MEEFQFSKFKRLCQKELRAYLEPALSKLETECVCNPERVATLRNETPRAFVLKLLFGLFYEKFHEIEKENLRLV